MSETSHCECRGRGPGRGAHGLAISCGGAGARQYLAMGKLVSCRPGIVGVRPSF